MTILLLTTLPNKVQSSLSALPGANLIAIDIALIPSKQNLLDRISVMLSHTSFDILLTYRCPHIIPEDIFSRFPLRLNIHPLPLPEFAGLNPWQSFFRSGRTSAEAVLHILEAIPDSGGIIMKEPYAIPCASQAREAADTAASILISRFFADYFPSRFQSG